MELETREGCRLAWVPQLSGELQCIVVCVSIYNRWQLKDAARLSLSSTVVEALFFIECEMHWFILSLEDFDLK